MKRKTLLMLICFIILNSTFLLAQDWSTSGNSLSNVGKLGTTNNKNVQFISHNSVRGVLTKDGDWGFGTTSPNTRVHINSDAGQNPFRVQVNGASKLYVDNGGGVSVGSSAIPPANGLYVSGNAGIGTTIPTEKLHVIGNILASGNINVTNLVASGNLDVTGTVGFGSVETFSDGGSNTIESNSNIVPDADGSWNLGTVARTWGSVHAISYLTTLSFSATKTAENLKAGLPEIMKLRPVSYIEGSEKKFGLIEKEVQSVLPEVTSDKELSGTEGGSTSLKTTAKLSLEYDALIPVLIKGMQDQQKIIMALQEKVAQLEAASSITSASTDNMKVGSNLITGASLEQNQPNPFNNSTVINYRLPQGTAGQINIYDNKGILMKSFKANESGQSTVNASDLKPGTYIYTLSVNGKLAATKKLVILN